MWHFAEKKMQVMGVAGSGNRNIGWCVGNRSAAAFRRFSKKIEHLVATFYSDDRESYSEVIPKARHRIGKCYAVDIEQNNSNIRHFFGRFTRRTKVVSKSAKMVLVT